LINLQQFLQSIGKTMKTTVVVIFHELKQNQKV